MKDLKEKFNWAVIGHQTQINFLQRSLVNKNLSHAYLFSGPKNIGKMTIAKLFIQSLICENLDQLNIFTPCNNCQNCSQLIKNIYPDYFEINLLTDKKEISIEQIKELQYHLKLKSFLENYKIAIISEAEKLNKESANALLKTLEEPFDKTIIILITDDLQNITPTIISRCQIIKFNYVNDDLIYNYLLNTGERRENIRLIAKIIQGRPGLYFQNQLSEFLENYKNHVLFFEKLINAPIYKKLELIEQLLNENDKERVEEIINIWLIYLHDIYYLKTNNSEKIINYNIVKNLNNFEKLFSLQKILELIKDLCQLPKKLQLNINQKFLFENLILKI